MSLTDRAASETKPSICADAMSRRNRPRSCGKIRSCALFGDGRRLAAVALGLVLMAGVATAQTGTAGETEAAVLNSPVMVEVVKIIPSLFWLVLAIIIVAIFYRPIRSQLIPLVSGLKIGGIECSFVREAIEASVALAKKHPRWQVQVSDDAAQVVMTRASRNMALLQNTKILWVDDVPDNNFNEIKMLHQLRMDVETAKSTDEAVARLAKQKYDIVLSDLSRDGDATAGLQMLDVLRAAYPGLPVVFYVGDYQAEKGIPPFAFGLTNRPDELLHIVLDVVERQKG